MNNRWGALLRFAIMKEALLNEDGALKRKPYSSVEEFTRENRFLPGIFPIATHLSENDIVKRVSQELTEETKKEEEPQSYLHIIGRYKRNGCSSVVVTPKGEEIPVQITCATRVEKGVDFSTDQILHFIGEKSTRTRKKIEYIVTGELYQLVTKYWYESEVINTLSDYMVLDNAQGLVKRILFDRKSARSILYFLAYAVSRAADGNNLADEDAVDLAVDEFNRQGFECLPVCTDEVICLIEEMRLWDYLMPQAGFGRWGDYFSRFLCVFALINGFSPWQYPGKNIGQIFSEIIPKGHARTARKIAQYMPYLCNEEQYLAVMQETLDNSKVQPYQAGICEIILYESLVYHAFEPSFLHKVLDLLFKDSIAEFQCNDIDNLLKGPNGSTIRSYVFRQFWEGIKSNEVAFNWITGAILNYEALNRGINPLEEAVESSILPFDNGDLLLSLSRISLLIWEQMDNHKKLFSEKVLSKNFVDVLLENIRAYNKLFYSTSASCLHDLITLGWLSPELLNEDEIFQTAITTLSEEDGRLWSERLLSILPWDDNRELPPNAVELGREYATRLEQELQKKAETCEPEVSYSVLVHLGFYQNRRLEKMLAFQKLHKYYRNNTPDATQKRRMQLIQAPLDKENLLHSTE